MSQDVPLFLTDHLEELRKRIIRSLVAFVVISGIGFFFVDSILNWFAKPIGDFVFNSPTDALAIRFKIAFGVSLIICFPYFLFQFWKYIEIALRAREKSLVLSVVPVSCILFYMGMFLAIFVVSPIALKFLLAFQSEHLKPLITLDAYLSFLLWMIMGFGGLFQLPLVIVALCYFNIITPAQLSKYRRHIIVIIFIVAAFLTPGPDVFSQLVLAVPTYLLFEISILICKRITPINRQ